MSTKEVVSFGPETWTKGDRGRESRWVSAYPAIRNMRWTTEMRLHPRARWRTGIVTANTAYGSNVAGLLNTDHEDAILVHNEAYKWDAPGSLSDHTLTLMSGSATQTNTARWARPQRIGPDSFDTLGYQVDVSSSSVLSRNSDSIFTEIQGFTGSSYQITGTTVHQGRLFVCGYRNSSGLRSFANRIWYSDPYDYMTISSAEQFFDLDGPVAGMAAAGPNLLIWTEDGEWHLLQGRGDPALGTLSPLGKGRIPSSHYALAEVDGGYIFVSSDHQALVQLSFAGIADDTALSRFSLLPVNLGLQSFTDYLFAPPASSPLLDVISGPIRATDSHLVKYNGVWVEDTYDTFTVDKNTHLFFDNNTGREVMVQPADLAGIVPWRVYSRSLFDGACDSDADPGLAETDEVEGYIETPIISVPHKQSRATRVYIDVATLGTVVDGGTAPTPALSVSALDENGEHSMVLGPGPDPLGTRLPGATGVTRIMATAPPLAHGRGFNIAISGIRGLAIERVTVEFEMSEGLLQ